MGEHTASCDGWKVYSREEPVEPGFERYIGECDGSCVDEEEEEERRCPQCRQFLTLSHEGVQGGDVWYECTNVMCPEHDFRDSPSCPRCGAPLMSEDEVFLGPGVKPNEFIYARRFICGSWEDSSSPTYKACNYIAKLKGRE